MTHRPFVAYTARNRMSCAFYTLVIRNAALSEKFNGGLDGFIKKYSAECNHDIVVDCSMSGDDTMQIIDDIVKYGLKPSEDFAIFDAAGYAIARAAASPNNCVDDTHEVDLGVNWLGAEISPDGFFVWYTGD